MRSKLLLFALPVAMAAFLLFGYSVQDNPNNDMAPSLTENSKTLSLQLDTIPPAGFPYATQFNFNYSAIGGVNGGTVGATYFNGKYYLNRWNSAVLYRYNANGPGGGPGTLADSISGYNGGAGAIRDMTVAPDGSGRLYLWGGSASTALYKMDSLGTRLATFTHTGAAYRAVAWDPNRKGFWSCNFGDNIVCRDTNGTIIRTITNTLAGKYGMGFDSTSSPDSAFLWVWSQVTGGLQNQLDKIYLGTGLSVKTYLFNTTAASIGIAGGAEVFVQDNKLILALNYQNQATCGYKLKDIGGGGTCVYTWLTQTSGTPNQLLTVSAVNSSIGWAAGVGPTVVRTTNGGTSWTAATGTGITGDVYNIYAWSANDALCTTSPSATFIYKTTNGGTTWTQVYTLAGGFINAIQMVSPTEGYAEGDPVGGKWTILKTTDGGTTWARMATEPAQVGTEAGWNNSLQIIGTNIWFGTNNTKVYRSTDLGLTWTSGATTGTVNTYAVHYNNATTGLAGGTAMVLSTDGGTSYSSVTAPGTAGNLNGIEGNGSDWWAIRSGNTIYRSTNGAASWTNAFVSGTAVFQDLDFAVGLNGCSVGWAVGNAGVIAKMENLVGITTTSSEVPSSYLLKQNYPNPFNPTTNITFALPKAGDVTLKVYDMSGKEVAVLVNEFKNAGSYLVGFNAANLPSGAYFYRIISGGFVETKKMMLVK
ncbi:MAG: T9SS type A sorting domain-containing protein [Ignavibacteria bacterium]|nr:T9SS type A sorting domain-containing protein [Ignavibacteria bacterium]